MNQDTLSYLRITYREGRGPAVQPTTVDVKMHASETCPDVRFVKVRDFARAIHWKVPPRFSAAICTWPPFSSEPHQSALAVHEELIIDNASIEVLKMYFCRYVHARNVLAIERVHLAPGGGSGDNHSTATRPIGIESDAPGSLTLVGAKRSAATAKLQETPTAGRAPQCIVIHGMFREPERVRFQPNMTVKSLLSRLGQRDWYVRAGPSVEDLLLYPDDQLESSLPLESGALHAYLTKCTLMHKDDS